MLQGYYNFEAQCSLPGLTTAASAHQAEQSFAGPKFTKHHGFKSPVGRLGQSSITEAIVHTNIQSLQGLYKM